MRTIEAKRLLRKHGYVDLIAKQDDNGLWYATVRETGLALWRSVSGSTKRNAINSLVRCLTQESSP